MSAAATRALKPVSHAVFSWKPTGRPQQTLAAAVSRSGVGLHLGARVTATLLPAYAGEGRYFQVEGREEARVAAEVGNAEPRSQLCVTLQRGEGCGPRIRTVEHLLSAMEALGVDNCRVEVIGGDEIPLLDGSAQEWVEAIRSAGLCAAEDTSGQKLEKLAPQIDEPVYLQRDDCFIAAFPSSQIHITYGIDFPKVPAIGCQWFSTFLDANIYSSKIAPARTFCIFEEIEKMRGAGLIKGGSLENAMVCSMSGGWLNPSVRFEDEPCRHKILDLIGDQGRLQELEARVLNAKCGPKILPWPSSTLASEISAISVDGVSTLHHHGDFSLLAQNGNQGFPIAHIIAYKAGHALHTDFLRHLLGRITVDQEEVARQC